MRNRSCAKPPFPVAPVAAFQGQQPTVTAFSRAHIVQVAGSVGNPTGSTTLLAPPAQISGPTQLGSSMTPDGSIPPDTTQIVVKPINSATVRDGGPSPQQIRPSLVEPAPVATLTGQPSLPPPQHVGPPVEPLPSPGVPTKNQAPECSGVKPTILKPSIVAHVAEDPYFSTKQMGSFHRRNELLDIASGDCGISLHQIYTFTIPMAPAHQVFVEMSARHFNENDYSVDKLSIVQLQMNTWVFYPGGCCVYGASTGLLLIFASRTSRVSTGEY